MQLLIKEMYESFESIKLSKTDKKLLQLLLQNSRSPITQLAKKIGVSKSAVSRRIGFFERELLLLGPALYYKMNSNFSDPFYWCEITTDFGVNQIEVSESLLKIKNIRGILWLNGPYNLLFGILSKDPQKVIEDVIKEIPIHKIRYRRVVNNWFNPPYIFKDVPDINRKTDVCTPEFKLSDYEIKLVEELEKSPRAPIVEIASKIKSSTKTVISRIAELRKKGFILAFTSHLNYWAVGLEVVSISVQIKGRESISKAISFLLSLSQTSNIWEMDGENNIGFVLWVKKHSEVSKILKDLQRICPDIREMDVSIVTGIRGK